MRTPHAEWPIGRDEFAAPSRDDEVRGAVHAGGGATPPERQGRPVEWSAVDGGHLRLFVALAGRRSEVVQPFDLVGAQLELVSVSDRLNPRGAITDLRSPSVSSRSGRPNRWSSVQSPRSSLALALAA